MNKTIENILHFVDDETKGVVQAFATSIHSKFDWIGWYSLYTDLLVYAENIDYIFNSNHKQAIKNAWDQINAHYEEEKINMMRWSEEEHMDSYHEMTA